MNFWTRLPQPIIGLAPMDGVTDAAFRLIVAQQGQADVSFTEFTNVGDICRGPDRMLSSLLYHECERPAVAQLYGKDPDLFYQAAHIVCELGFDGLDINMGCPSKNVASSGSGAGLIRTPDVAHAILRAARQGVTDWANGQTLLDAGLKRARAEMIGAMNLSRAGASAIPRRLLPVSVKTRLGYDSVIVEQWISHLLEEQPAAITVHGRTLEQMYRGEADWNAIARAGELAKGTGTRLLGNGDLHSMQDVVTRIRDTGVHGVLVGRGALGSPWFFKTKDVARALARCHGDGKAEPGSSVSIEADLAKRFEVMIEHARQFETIFGIAQFPRMRKHLGWYCKGFPHAASLRASMVRASSVSDVQRILEEYLRDHPSPSDEPNITPADMAFPIPVSCG
ncbi:tRNA dihydrouridine synthase [Nitrospira sp. Nam74]